MYSNLGSEVGGGDTEVPSDDERVDSEVGTTMIPPDQESVVSEHADMPAPLQYIKGGPQRAPGPDGYDSGLGSDLPTAALSGNGSVSDYFQHGGDDQTEKEGLSVVDE